MTIAIQKLIEGRKPPITVGITNTITQALEIMDRCDFNQLPVVDDNQRVLGLITSNSILRALRNFGVTANAIHVRDAMERAVKYRQDEELRDVLNELRDTYSVLVVDSEDRLLGIITSYDVTEYFRQQYEDAMLLSEIESEIKEHIQAAFTDLTGRLNVEDLNQTIYQITDTRQELQGRFITALRKAFKAQGSSTGELTPEMEQQVFDETFSTKSGPKKFEDLSLGEYIDVLLHKGRADYHKQAFGLETSALRRVLSSVREARNALAHHKRELTPEEKEQIAFCANWFKNHRVLYPIMLPEKKPAALLQLRESPGNDLTADAHIAPVEDVVRPDESRYAALILNLTSRSENEDHVELTFGELDQILGGLPNSARQYRSWWANDSVGHIHSQQWLDAGWRVAEVDLNAERVVFARIPEREAAYRRFFTAIQNDLQTKKGFPLKRYSVSGLSWQVYAALPEAGPYKAVFAVSFARGQRLRVELYLDTGEAQSTKQLFDALAEKRPALREQFGQPELSWERLDLKRASRIAAYTSGSVLWSNDAVANLQYWALEALIRLYGVFNQPVQDALKML